MAKKRTKPVYRSAKTGRFVSQRFLQGHAGTTVTEHVRKGQRV